jgi:hypothetical protein
VLSFPTRFGIGYSGQAVGIPTNAGLRTSLGKTARTSATGAGWQCYDACSTAPLSINPSATVTLNLLTGATGLLDPLGQAISTAPFVHVFALLVWHDPASLSSGVSAFGGASGNLFQGPLGAASILTLGPGQRFAFSTDTGLAGFLVDGTHKNVDLTNNDATALHVATVRVFIMGKTT